VFGLDLPVAAWAAEEGIANEEMQVRLSQAVEERAKAREELLSQQQMRSIEKSFLLQMIDLQWREHLMHLDHLRNVIGLRGYGQRDPLNEYKTEAFTLFEKLLTDLRTDVTRWLMTVEIMAPPPEPESLGGRLIEVHMDPHTGENERAFSLDGPGAQTLSADDRAALPPSALPEGWQRASRNAPCPCGSGRKFKHCHGALV
jgi:preprotein translocase subunit SecA